MTDPRLQGHALVALGLTAMLAATPPEPAEWRASAPAPAFVAIQPFDEQLVAVPMDIPDTTTTAAPPDPSSGLFAA